MFTRAIQIALATATTAVAAVRAAAPAVPRARVSAKLTYREIKRLFGNTEKGRARYRARLLERGPEKLARRLRRKVALGRAGAF